MRWSAVQDVVGELKIHVIEHAIKEKIQEKKNFDFLLCSPYTSDRVEPKIEGGANFNSS